LAAHRYCRPRLAGLCLSLAIATEGSRSSTQDPGTGSRCLYAGRHLARKQVSSRLIPAQLHSPVLTSSEYFRHLNGSSLVFAFLSLT
jgi:hypothetical protein